METLIVILKFLAVIVGIAFLSVMLFAIVTGFIKTIIDNYKERKFKKELSKEFDLFIENLKKSIEEEDEKEKTSKKTVKKASNKKKTTKKSIDNQ